MRRILLVALVVFAVGLATLLWIDRGLRKPAPAPEAGSEPTPATLEPTEEGQGEQVAVPDEHGNVTQIALSGPLRLSDVDPQTKLRRYEFRAEDSRSLAGGAIEAQGIELEVFGPSGEEIDRRLKARRGQVQVLLGHGPPRIDDAEPMVLEEVSIHLESGLEFAPLDLTVPRVEARLGSRTLSSADELDVTGRGLAAHGQGLFADANAHLVRIESRPHVELTLPDGARATLDADGPLGLTDRPDLGPDMAVVEARENARLELIPKASREAAEPLVVEAPLVRLIGHVLEDPQRFVPVRAEAEEGVVLSPREGRFLGDRAEVDFDEHGQATTGRLLGSPSGQFDLRGRDLSGLGAEVPTGSVSALPVEVRGASRLELGFGARPSLDLDGPATVRLPSLEVTVTSQGPLTGGADEGLGYGSLEASGGVEVVSGKMKLEAPEILVEALGTSEQEAFARLTTRSATHVSGDDEAGERHYDLLARQGLIATRRGESFAVPRAHDVELTVTGAQPLHARADELHDLDAQQLTFEALGDVEIDEARGSGSGQRLVSHGRDHAELFGQPGEPATITLPQGTLTAARIEGEGRHLVADGGVHAVVEVEDVAIDLHASWVDAGPGVAREGRPQEEPADWELSAGGGAHAVVTTPEAKHTLTALNLWLGANEREGDRRLVLAGLEAQGEVDAIYEAGLVLEAHGDRLTFDATRKGELSPLEGERVHVEGELAEKGVSFTMSAARLEYGLEQLNATAPNIEVEGLDLPLLGEEVADTKARLRAVAGHLLVSRDSMIFHERVYIERVSGEDVSWSLDADRVELLGGEQEPGGETVAQGHAREVPAGLPVSGALKELYAWGGFVASSADGLQVLGDSLHVSRNDNRVTVNGSPAAVVGRGVRWESEWFELDRTTRSIKASAGQVHSTVEGARPWSMRYASLEPEERDDETIQVLREPVLTSGDEELRASWALFWIDPRRWGSLEGGENPVVTGEQRARPRMRSLFGELLRFDGIDWLRAVYLEGNVAYSLEGEGKAQAQAVYVDLQDGQGWVRDVSLQTRMPFTRRRTPMKLSAEWLRHSADGSYSAVGAVATTCEFEVPHYVVRIGDLRIIPRAEERLRRDPQTGEEHTEEVFVGWDVVARENRLRLWHDVGLPLPKIEVPVDDHYHVETEDVSILGLRPLSFGNDAKFGAFIGTSFSLDLSWLAGLFDELVGVFAPGGEGPGARAGRADLNARWLNGRNGLLLGIEIPFYSPGRYWIDVAASGIFDDGEDRGLVRVPRDERDLWRGWYHARGRYLMGDREWLDAVGTIQSDPGFQAQFFEGEYLRFEERESYLHYRKAEGDRAFAATFEAPPQSWRTEVVEQPRLRFFDGLSRVSEVGKLSLLYGWSADAGYFSRQEGSGGYEAPYPDGLGERDVLRFDTRHRLEMPLDLELAGLRATPYLEGRFTAWDEGADPDDQPARAGLLAGAELATTFYRAFRSGVRHAISPWVGVRTDLATVDDDVPLVPIDRTELPLKGKVVDFGVRSRWTHSERPDTLDIELAIAHASDVEPGQPEGWLPLRTRGVWFSSMLGVPYVISHDARYDLDDERTDYSRALLAFEPIPQVDVELGHHFGRDPVTQKALYEAVSLGAIWRFTTKWELEGRQTLSSQGDGRLSYGLLLRRLGHDFVVELETRFVAGEGESFGLRLTPLVLWDPSGFSLLDRARREPW